MDDYTGTRTNDTALDADASAWLSPGGEWYHAGGYGGHSASSRIILTGVYGIVLDDNTWYDGVDMLEGRGWVHISGGSLHYSGRDMTGPARAAIGRAVQRLVIAGITRSHHMRLIASASAENIGG